jgi:hypothetical protein
MMEHQRSGDGATNATLVSRARTPTGDNRVDYNTYHPTRNEEDDLDREIYDDYSDDEGKLEYGDQLIYSRYTKRRQQIFHFVNVGIPVIILLLIAAGCVLAVIITRTRTASSAYTSVSGDNGAVAADDPVCSDLGLSILQKGGNAIDASITTALCLGVMRPYASGIGGGGFMILHLAGKNVTEFIDFRETAPAASTYDMFYNDYDVCII